VILQTSTWYSSSFQTVCSMSAVMVSMAILIRTFSSGIHTHPVSWNCAYHLRMELSDGGCFPNLVRNFRWTIVLPQSFRITLYYIIHNVHILKLIHRPTNWPNKLKFMTNITIYMFRYQGAILRASFRSKEYKYTTPLRTTHFTLHTSHAASGRDLFGSRRRR